MGPALACRLQQHLGPLKTSLQEEKLLHPVLDALTLTHFLLTPWTVFIVLSLEKVLWAIFPVAQKPLHFVIQPPPTCSHLHHM